MIFSYFFLSYSFKPRNLNQNFFWSKFKKIVLELRSKLKKHLITTNDLSFYPESYMIEHALKNPLSFGDSNKEEIKSLIEISDLVLLPFEDAEVKITRVVRQNGQSIYKINDKVRTHFIILDLNLTQDFD